MAVDAHELEAPQGGAVETAKDLFAGAVGGIAQVLVGKLCIPFRVRLGVQWQGARSWSRWPFSEAELG
jgi:solute carrier family 25 carnitine/acylcarnitine transporter 20/29